MDILATFLVYGAPFLIALGLFLFFRRRSSRRAEAIHSEAVEAGLTEPASLHPHIDPALCCGAAACVAACPEGDVIGVVNGKARLIDPTACIGHGACAAACPTQAISLVFGTRTRGVELPVVSPDFETSVPGLFIAGELGGMGLIRNAVTQGRQAVEAIQKTRGTSASPDMLDLLIVGAGPAGIAASLTATSLGLRHLTIEQESFGGTVAHFPRGKIVMTRPVTLPIVGEMKFTEVSKEKLLDFWTHARKKAGLDIAYGERLESLTPAPNGFEIVTSAGTHRARTVLMAIGRRGTPRKLGVPGEDMSKVVYRMDDPHQYDGMDVLVVGGGDSALEAAATLAEETSARVTLSYRGDAFQRARKKNRDRVSTAESHGALAIRLNSNVTGITHRQAGLKSDGQEIALDNDAVIVCAGGVLPTGLLKTMGVTIVTKYGEP